MPGGPNSVKCMIPYIMKGIKLDLDKTLPTCFIQRNKSKSKCNVNKSRSRSHSRIFTA